MNDLTPSDPFIINSQRMMTDFEQRSLTALYRPLLTANSYSLIMTFWELNQESDGLNEQRVHTVLLNWLGIDLPSILEARGRLESLGLIKTYRKQDGGRTLFLYRLQPPADPIKFFKDDTLSALLLGVIGETEFERLSKVFLKPTLEKEGFYDVSKKLGDYFRLGSSVVNKPETIKKVQNQLEADGQTTENLALNTTSFDFKLLEQMLSTSFVDRQSLLDNEHLIMVEQTIYGISETQMSQFVKEAANYQDNKIDASELKRRIANAYRGRSTADVQDDKNNLSGSEKINRRELKGLTNQEKAVIEATYSMAPSDFIKSLKEESGGFLTASEERIITNLVNTGMIPVSVVNFLIYYLLIDQGNATLNKNLSETIANSWIKNKIKSPVEALKFVRNREEQKQINRSYTKNKRVVQRETLPDWAKDTAPKKNEAKTNPQTTKEINEQLRKLRSRGKEG